MTPFPASPVASKPLVFHVMPRYSSTVDARCQRAFLSATKGGCQISFGTPGIGGSPIESQTSVLPQAFNAPWIIALNLRKTHSISGWSMQHADIEPEFGYLDILWREKQRLNCDVLSCVVPIKLPTGVTSTAVGDGSWSIDSVSGDEKPRRLTMHEIYKLPRTFNIDDVCKMFPDIRKDIKKPFLMVNTGCFLVDFSKPWVEKTVFRFLNHNQLGADGLWHTACRSEDYDFSFQAHKLGLSVYATTLVSLNHHGDCAFPNNQAWGTQQTDDEWAVHVAGRKNLTTG